SAILSSSVSISSVIAAIFYTFRKSPLSPGRRDVTYRQHKPLCILTECTLSGHSSEGSRRLPNRPAPNVRKPDVAIIGAGVIGLAIAWRLAAQGTSVQVFDRGAAGAGASHAAAGMLAACAEAEPGEEALVALGRESQARWPAFAAELLKVSGVDVELRAEGTLVVALTADDQARLSHQLVSQQKLGLPLQWISAAETRRREPHLAGKLAGAVFSPEDTQVDNRKLATALRLAAEVAGASVCEHRAVSTISSRGGGGGGLGPPRR